MLNAVNQGGALRASKMRTLSLCVFMASALAGCAGLAPTSSRPVSLVQGPPITDIFTPFDLALSCLNGQLRPDVTFSVGAILDQTGKDAITNGGSGKYISQGAGDMVQSALFRAGVTLLNRRDPRIMETEVKWGVRSPKNIAASNYFITGSINSLDFIPGGGFDVQVAGVGPQYSQTRIIVGLDLSLTDANTSRVVANVSLQKQIAAQDYGIGAGRFAGVTLLNVQIGAGEREATNFALRQMLNLATFELLNQVMDPSSYVQCRERIPSEYGSLNLTRSAVQLGMYKKKLDAVAKAKAKPAPAAALVAEAEAPAAIKPSPAAVAPVPAPAPLPESVSDTAPGNLEPAKTETVAAAKAPVIPVPAVVTVKPVQAPVVQAPEVLQKPVVAVPAPISQPVMKPQDSVSREMVEDKPAPQSKPVQVDSSEKLATVKQEKVPVSSVVAPKPVSAPVVVTPKLAPVAEAPAAVTQPVTTVSEPVLREAAEEKPARKKPPVAAESREKLAQAKPALSPAPESAADAETTLIKPSVQAKPVVPAAPAEARQKPVVSKPALSPVPEPVAATAKPLPAKSMAPVAPAAVAKHEVPAPASKLKAMSKPSLLDGDLSVMTADDAAPSSATSSGKAGAKPESAPSKEKMANVGKPALPAAKLVAARSPAVATPAVVPAVVAPKPLAAPATKLPKLATETKTKPAFASAVSKSNTVAFVSSDDDGSGKYWSDDALDDARINAPLR